MLQKTRVVFDTNIYISALLFGGNPESCLFLARDQAIELYITRAILLELAIKLENKFFHTEKDIEVVFKNLSSIATIVEPKIKIEKIKKAPPDNKILECGVEISADYIVSGDKKHLLSLGKFQDIPIISAKEFLDLFFGKN